MKTQQIIKIPSSVIKSISEYIDSLDFTQNEKKLIKKKSYKLYYFILYKNTLNLDNFSKKYYNNITFKKLRKIIPNFKINNNNYTYKFIIDTLEKCKVIEINKKYKQNGFTKSFRINSEFLRKTDWNLIEINLKYIFDNNNNTKEMYKNKYKNFEKEIENIYNCTLDIDEIYNFLILNKGMKLKPKTKKDKYKTVIDDERYLDDFVIFRYINIVLRFYFKNHWFAVSDEGRFYNSLTSFPSIIYKYIKYNNQYLTELDISESQPLLLSTIVDNDDFKKDVTSGNFYQKIADNMKISRNKVKIYVYSKLLFNNRKLRSGDFYKTLEKVYPGLINSINDIKDKNNLSLLLQKMEADIIVNLIGKDDKIIYTKHDSVSCLNNNVEFIKNKIKNLYKNKYNINIKINII